MRMSTTTTGTSLGVNCLATRKLRLLVVIASFGDKNLDYLKGIIHAYQSMDMDVDVVVVSNAPKELGSTVKVIVGLPSSNPWSLPFAHKPIFAQNADHYDLFIYSEDDMAVTEENIHAFIRVTPYLELDEIAGYLRYEINAAGTWWMPDAHGVFHWKPDSVRCRGPHTIAEFTNEHAAFYLLTQAQLKRAIVSGGFLRGPCEGRYDMLCTAATDPYTNCGFRKVICISSFEDFLIHHLSNRYVGQMGLSLSSIKEQVETLVKICNNDHPASSLCELESKLLHGRWSKFYDEQPLSAVVEMVPPEAKTILSVGSGLGATEMQLKQRGAQVTALPLDSVAGAAVARQGVEVIYGTLGECLDQLGARQFDCVLTPHLLHLQPDPGKVVNAFCRLIGAGGTLVASGPNFHSLRICAKRILGKEDFRKLGNFAESGIHLEVLRETVQSAKRVGLNPVICHYFNRELSRKASIFQRYGGRFTGDSWVLQARR